MDAATATLSPDTYSVLVTAVNPTGAVTWTRVVGGVEMPLGTGDQLRDFPPLNQSTVYIASDSVTTEVTSAVTVTASGALLNATDRNQVEHVVVVKQPPLEWEARSTSHKILSRRDPVVIIAPSSYASGQMVLLLESTAQRRRILDLFDSGAPLLLRTDCPDAVDDMSFLPTNWADPLLSESLPRGRRLLEIDYQAVSELPPAWAPDPEWAYDAVVAAHADYEAVRAAYATYTELLVGPLP